MLKPKNIEYIEAIFAVTVWGASFIATKIALREISPLTIVWMRFTIGVVILGVAVFARRQFMRPTLVELAYFGLLGFLGITFHQWLQSTGLVTAQASTTAWIVASTPIFMAGLGWLLLREKLDSWQIAGIAVATLGVLFVATDGNLRLLAAGRLSTPGDFLILVSAVNWAVFSTLSRRALLRHPATRVMFYVMTAGWFFTSLLFFTAGRSAEVTNLGRQGWSAILFLGIFCTGLAYIAWYDALQALSTSQAGVFLYLEPLVAMLVAGFLLGERVTAAGLIGGTMILGGVWLVQNRRG